MMRLSEAIALGRTTIEKFIAAELNGCALGMAANAIGIKKDYCQLYEAWPWLGAMEFSRCPVDGCPHPSFMAPAHRIGHLFDAHVVCVGEPFTRWTLDQLIDWVRSVEPNEDASESAEQLLEEIRQQAVSK